MFFTKKPKQSEQVKCETCKHWVDKADAQIIMSRYGVYAEYCPMHRKKYDLVYQGKFFKTIPAHEIEVDEEGKPIKKK